MSEVARTTSVAGVELPTFFYGTAWKEDDTETLVEEALDAGFRAVDTANQRRHYVESAVGNAVSAKIAAGAVSREDLFLQTKYTYVMGQDHRLPYDPSASYEEQVRQSFESSLSHLQTDVVDAYVLHAPSKPFRLGAADEESWQAMEALARSGKARLLGVSNVSAEQLRALIGFAEIAPAIVQNRCFARDGWDADVRAICRAEGVLYQGFSLLTANRRELSSPPVQEIVRRSGRTLPQVVFRFALQLGMIPLTGTTDEAHMREDLECYDFSLREDDLRALERAGRSG